MADPTVESVNAAVNTFNKIGFRAFIDKYATGHPPIRHYINHKDCEKPLPLKALWAASHNPFITTGVFHKNEAETGFKKLGFADFVQGDLGWDYEEGDRRKKEIRSIARAPGIVKLAKHILGLKCQVCGFDFGEKYGRLGAGYIECHHKDPLSGREGKRKVTTVDDLAVLCSNCHRMVHRNRKTLTIEELKAELTRAEAKISM